MAFSLLLWADLTPKFHKILSNNRIDVISEDNVHFRHSYPFADFSSIPTSIEGSIEPIERYSYVL